MRGLVREMSEGGTTRYSETGCLARQDPRCASRSARVTWATVGSRYRPKKLIAVERTPERSFSLLFNTSARRSRPLDADASSKCAVVIIRRSV